MRERLRRTEAFTADATLSKERAQGLKTNRGATAAVTLTLPPAAECVGLPPLRMLRIAAYAFRADPSGTEQIMEVDAGLAAAGKYEELATDGAVMELVSDGTNWIIMESRGTINEQA